MNQYFCVLPFFSLETGFESSRNIYCCRLQPGTAIENVQNFGKKLVGKTGYQDYLPELFATRT